MSLPKEFIRRVESRLGKPLKYSADCEILAQAIEDATGERLGVTTIKRLFGFAGEKVTPRGSTMDIFARYLGYNDLRDMERQLGDAADISMFTAVDEIRADSLAAGTRIQLTYSPGRRLLLTYAGDGRFIVDEAENSKLLKGDIIRATHFAKGFELLVSDVVRDGASLGQYHAAKDGGLTSLEIIA